MAQQDTAPPDGIADQHVQPTDARHRRANPASLIVIGCFLLLACLGLMGGQSHPSRSVESPAVRLTLNSPETLRNGMFFETRLLIEPRQPIGEVVLALSPDLWRDITINSGIPAAEKEEYADGMIRMSFGPGEPGKPIAIKFDGQVNPPLVGRSRGEVAVYDGDRRLLALPWTLRVLP
jgi:hypothetical protein